MKSHLVAWFCVLVCLFCMLTSVLAFRDGRHRIALLNTALATVNGVCAFLNFRLARRA